MRTYILCSICVLFVNFLTTFGFACVVDRCVFCIICFTLVKFFFGFTTKSLESWKSWCCPKDTKHDDVIKWKHFPRCWPFARNSTVPGEFPAQRPVTRSFDVFFLRLNKRLIKESWGWWFETPSHPLWRHRNECVHCSWHALCTRHCNLILKNYCIAS